MTAGQEFVKKIGPFGSALFLIVFIAFLVICFMPPKDKAADEYTPPNTSEYYAQSGETLLELKTELEDNLFPRLEGECHCALSEKGDRLDISFSESSLEENTKTLLTYYDKGLFNFTEVKAQ